MRTPEPSCKYNELIKCPTQSGCEKCGWYAPEMQRRKLRIKLEGLKLSQDGKYRLLVR